MWNLLCSECRVHYGVFDLMTFATVLSDPYSGRRHMTRVAKIYYCRDGSLVRMSVVRR